jgi:hypothetical protein
MHHLVQDVPAETLRDGLAGLGLAIDRAPAAAPEA